MECLHQLKFVHGEDVYKRYVNCFGLAMDTLYTTIESILGLPTNSFLSGHYIVTYNNDTGDYVTVNSCKSLNEAISFALRTRCNPLTLTIASNSSPQDETNLLETKIGSVLREVFPTLVELLGPKVELTRDFLESIAASPNTPTDVRVKIRRIVKDNQPLDLQTTSILRNVHPSLNGFQGPNLVLSSCHMICVRDFLESLVANSNTPPGVCAKIREINGHLKDNPQVLKYGFLTLAEKFVGNYQVSPHIMNKAFICFGGR